MPAAKRTPERKSRSGAYVPDDLRGTGRVVVRCSPELAARARRAATSRGRTLAQVLEAGVYETERMPRPMTATEDDAACRADREYDRMRDDDR